MFEDHLSTKEANKCEQIDLLCLFETAGLVLLQTSLVIAQAFCAVSPDSFASLFLDLFAA